MKSGIRQWSAVSVALAFALFAWGCPEDDEQPPDEQKVTYGVTFNGTWSAETHPQDFPTTTAHWSGLIGGTHSDAVSFWEPGGMASKGIEDMAEIGSKTALGTEVEQAQNAGTAEFLLSGNGISPSPGITYLDFEITRDFPLVTLVSMVAPSPDWFVGVHGLSLLDDNGQWIEELTVDLYGYDAGTEDGTTFSMSNAASEPQVPIAPLEDGPFLVDGEIPKLGTFEFVRQHAVPNP